MYAIVLTGGKQYKVAEGDVVSVEKLDAEVGETVTLPALMVKNEDKLLLGADAAKAEVTAEVLRQDKAKKIMIFRYKAKKNERKRQGHRQPYTMLKIVGIKA